MLRYYFFISFFALLCNVALSQTPNHQRFKSSRAFAFESIYDVYQDKNGFIWLGTDVGLARFDGHEYVTFPSKNIYGKSVSNILQLSDNSIWCQNFSGQIMFVKGDSLSVAPGLSVSANYHPFICYQDSLLALLGDAGIYFYSPKTKMSIVQKLPSTPYFNFTLVKHANHFTLIDSKEEKIKYYSKSGLLSERSIQTTSLLPMMASLNNQAILVTKKYPFLIEDVKTKKIKPLKEINNTILINNVTTYEDKYIAVLTSNGIYIYDAELNYVRLLFEGENISCLLKDKQDNYWASTLKNGLLLSTLVNSFILHLNQNPTALELKTENTVIFGNDKNEVFEMKMDGSRLLPVFKSNVNHAVRALHYNAYQNELLISNHQLEIKKDGKLNAIATSVNEIKSVDNSHYLLSEGASLSLFPFKEKDKLAAWYNSNRLLTNERLSLQKNYIRAKSADILGDSLILVATTTGVLKITKEKKSELLWNGNRLFANTIVKLNHTLYVGSVNNGIFKYKDNVLSPFISSEQLGNSELYKVKVYDNILYVLTYNGTYLFNTKGELLYSLLRSDGFFDTDAVDFIVKNDTLLIANYSGFIGVPLKQKIRNESPPHVVISKISLNDRPIPKDTLLNLGINESIISLFVSTIDYRSNGATKTFYRINGGQWIIVNDGKITLASLGADSYTVEIKAVSERGINSPQFASFRFVIHPPIYKTWWFLLCLFLLASLLVFLMVKVRIKSIQQKNNLLNEKMNLEKELHKSMLSSIKAQMNPHFLFNALNTIQSYIYLSDKKTASQYLVHFSELVRIILDMSNKESISLTEELKALDLYLKLEKMRFEDDFNYRIENTITSTDDLKIPSMLVQPYVENSIKHGLLHKKGKKELSIYLQQTDKKLLIRVIDNGIGIEKSKEINAQRQKHHQSFATHANKKRFDLLNKYSKDEIGVETINLVDANNICIGTEIKLSIPFS
jgi:two-component sensor histidine kinase